MNCLLSSLLLHRICCNIGLQACLASARTKGHVIHWQCRLRSYCNKMAPLCWFLLCEDQRLQRDQEAFSGEQLQGSQVSP